MAKNKPDPNLAATVKGARMAARINARQARRLGRDPSEVQTATARDKTPKGEKK